MNKKKKVELVIQNITNSQAEAGAFALLLGEVEGSRQLPVIIGASEAQAMMIFVKGIKPPRPLTHALFASCLDALGVSLLRVLIYKVDNGVFYSYIYLKADEAIIRVDARTSDAVAMALRMKAPIFIYEEILESEHLRTGSEAFQKNPLEDIPDPDAYESFREFSINMLYRELIDAVNSENYERAARIRDEINKRNEQE